MSLLCCNNQNLNLLFDALVDGNWNIESIVVKSDSEKNLLIALLYYYYTDRNILEDSYKLVKHFPDFPL